MKLTLDHTQRLNLHALLGAQRVNVAGVRAIWAIQDKLALDSAEEKTLELKRELALPRVHDARPMARCVHDVPTR
jgi:hypothetical protein